ncbi:hypothetical protein ACF3N7_05340 [Cruoricaptor ignavus]|uniref:hypothetical protein n=1 Tax=Cruoricaptor ignavus TaxID=1118202 RepID=UPI00370D8983
MEQTIYAKGGGRGMVLENAEKEKDFILPKSIELHGNILKPGDYTNVDGYFIRPIRYCGIVKNSEFTEMVFHAGDDGDLFGLRKFYYILYWITPERIANVFKEGTARDFHWKGDHWH